MQWRLSQGFPDGGPARGRQPSTGRGPEGEGSHDHLSDGGTPSPRQERCDGHGPQLVSLSPGHAPGGARGGAGVGAAHRAPGCNGPRACPVSVWVRSHRSGAGGHGTEWLLVSGDSQPARPSTHAHPRGRSLQGPSMAPALTCRRGAPAPALSPAVAKRPAGLGPHLLGGLGSLDSSGDPHPKGLVLGEPGRPGRFLRIIWVPLVASGV